MKTLGSRYGIGSAHLNAEGFPKSHNISKAIGKQGGKEDAKQWAGWGTGLKPAVEDWILCCKPISEKNIAANVLKWGTGGINIDACRVREGGRYPANFMHDGSPEVLAEFEKYGKSKSSKGTRRKPGRMIGNGTTHGKMVHKDPDRGCGGYEDEGTIARFFFCSKASNKEREAGCESLPVKEPHEITGRKKDRPQGKTTQEQESKPAHEPTYIPPSRTWL